MKEQEDFGKYSLIEKVAITHTFEVWRAILKSAGGVEKQVFLKRVHSHLSENSEFSRQFITNARITALLNHAGILQILDLGIINDRLYIAEEFVHGKDLRSIFNRFFKEGKTLPYPAITFIILEILKTLEHIHNKSYLTGKGQHSMNIIHGNLTPQNIIITWDGNIKLTNFLHERRRFRKDGIHLKVLSERLEYSSPEEFEDMEIDARADIFSAGIIFYEALTGINPFRSARANHVIDNIKRRPVPSVRTFNADIPEPLDIIIKYAIEKDRAKRFQTSSHFREKIEKFLFDNQIIYTSSDLSELLSRWFKDEFPKEGKKEQKITTFPSPHPPSSSPAVVKDSALHREKEVDTIRDIEEAYDIEEETQKGLHPAEKTHPIERTMRLDSIPSHSTYERMDDEKTSILQRVEGEDEIDSEKTVILDRIDEKCRDDPEKTRILDVSSMTRDDITVIMPQTEIGVDIDKERRPPHRKETPILGHRRFGRRSLLVYTSTAVILALTILLVIFGERRKDSREGILKGQNLSKDVVRAAGEGSRVEEFAELKIVVPEMVDAEIFIDDRRLEGKGPFDLKLESTVSHLLKISRKGYPLIQHEVTLKKGEIHILYLDFLTKEGVKR